MAAVIAHAMIPWQESAAAVPLASLCSRTARPAKVKHHHSNCTCHQINLLLVVLWGTLELCYPLGAHRNYNKAIYVLPVFLLAVFPTCLLDFLSFRLYYHCFAPTTAPFLLPPIQLLPFSCIFWVLFCYATSFLDSFSTTLTSPSFLSFGRAPLTRAAWIIQKSFFLLLCYF